MNPAEDAQAMRDAVGLVLAVARINDGGLSAFTELSTGYGLDERQRGLVHMLAVLAAHPEAPEDLEEFALFLAGRER